MVGNLTRYDKLPRDTGTLKTIQKLKRKTTVDSEKSFDLDRGRRREPSTPDKPS